MELDAVAVTPNGKIEGQASPTGCRPCQRSSSNVPCLESHSETSHRRGQVPVVSQRPCPSKLSITMTSPAESSTRATAGRSPSKVTTKAPSGDSIGIDVITSSAESSITAAPFPANPYIAQQQWPASDEQCIRSGARHPVGERRVGPPPPVLSKGTHSPCSWRNKGVRAG
jgi:hypothetical protein